MRRLTTTQQSPFERVSRRFGLFVVAPLLLVLSLPVAVEHSRRPDYGFSVHGLVVRSVDPDGPGATAGIVPGDRIVAVGGRTVQRTHEFFAARAAGRDLRPLVFSLRTTDGALKHTTVSPAPPSQADLIHSYSLWVAGLAFLLIGWWVLWRRTDPVARNFHFLSLVFAFFLLDIPDHGNHAYMLAKDHLRALLQLMLPAFFLRFFLLFPAPTARRRGVPRYRLLLLPGWLLFAAAVALDSTGTDASGGTILAVASLVYALVYFGAGLVIFARRVLRRDRPIEQTKLRVVLIGLVGGLVPFLVATVLANVDPGGTVAYWQYLSLSLLLVPVAFALAIMRYGALDTRFVVRVGLVYGLLTLLVVLSYFLIVGIVGNLLARIFGAETWPVIVVIAAGSGLVIMPLRNLVQVWIDRTFYPSRRADRQAMGRLAEELSGLIEPAVVVRTIEDRLRTLYRPRRFALFLPAPREEGGYRARLAGGTDEAFLAADSGLTFLLDRLRRPVFREELENEMLALGTDAASLRVLSRLDLALVVPLVTGNRLLGFIGFGAKEDGALYSQDDLANLRAFAVQAATVVESRQLYQASLDRKRLETELEVARDIQASLLPGGPLDAHVFTIAGHNEPCRMVGGDYFDYFLLENGDLIFAIADVAGKGVPASLMMTSVRTAFRQEARPGVGPAEIASHLNHVVTTLGSPGHFICFFCGVLRPATGLLRFCNAGMEQPVLFRPRNNYRQVLKKGGPVLGVDADTTYREGALGLQDGDRLFLYTDGLTEQQDAGGQFFDAPRLLDLVESHLDDQPMALLGKVFASVDAFGCAERSDDRTAILLEIRNL